jgi:uncharacterized protein (DUF1810 family)
VADVAVFQELIDKYFEGKPDRETLRLLGLTA